MKGDTSVPPDDIRPPYLWAALCAGVVFLLYALTLAPTTAFWDASEYITTAYGMGIPHPPGNPLFVVLARAWVVLLEPTGLSVAVRVNLFSAFMSAAAHGFWFLVIHHVLGFLSRDRVFRLVGAAASVLVSATAFTVWNHSNVNEKVYTVSLLTIALLSWLAIRWRERLATGGDHRPIVLMAFILALSVGNHLMAFLAAPALGLFILLAHPRLLLRWSVYPSVTVAALLGLSVHLVLPLRAELDPVINEGAPECAELGDALLSVSTYGRRGCETLNASLTREMYKVPGAPGPGLTGPRQASIASQYVNYLQYFDWQWARGVSGEDPLLPPARIPFTMLFVALGVAGALAHFGADRTSFWYVAALFGTLSVGLVWYMNFKYGYSISVPAGEQGIHEARERDYFFIASFSVWALWVGVGLSACWKALEARFGSRLLAAPVMAVAFIPLALNVSWADRSHDYAARDWAYNVLMGVEPYSVLFTFGDNDTFPLWYLQEVEGVRRDVQVVVGEYLKTDWYPKQVRELTRPCPEGVDPLADPSRIVCQRPYEALPAVRYGTGAAAPDQILVDTGGPVIPPTRTALGLDDETIDRVARTVVPVEEGVTVELGLLSASIPAGTRLTPRERFTLQILADSLEDRPIYFSSAGPTVHILGLDEHLVREGLTFRLVPEPTDRPGVVRMPVGSPIAAMVGPYVDSERTELLLDRVFMHRNGLPDWDVWPDRTVGIPHFYARAYWGVAQAALMRGDEEASQRYARLAERWAELGS